MTTAPVLASRIGRHRIGIGLALILAFGAALRVAYAVPGLDSRRFFDERYGFDNVRKVLATWSFEPATIYYPSPVQTWPQALAIGASQWLWEERGVEAARIVHPRGWLTPTAYLLARLISVAYGTLTLAVLFLVGRRMISPGAGLLAALTLAALPLHIHASSMFKPDALLVLGVVLAFQLSLVAIESCRPRDYALAGLAVSLAASAKVMGGLVAVVLAVGTLAVGWRSRRRVALLALSAATSLVAFLLLNPHARQYPAWVAHLQADYARRAAVQEMTRGGMAGEVAAYLFGPQVHGPLFAALALAGLTGLAASLLRPLALAPEARAQRAMLVSFPVVYAAAYAAATPYFKDNNMLPIVPFTILAAVWLMGTAWGAVRGAWIFRPRPARAVGATALVLALALPGPLALYRTLTPTTFDRAVGFLTSGPDPVLGRVLFAEHGAEPKVVWKLAPASAKEPFGLVVAERLAGLAPRRLDLADGELFPAKRFDGPDGAFYAGRLGRVAAEQTLTVRPGLFALRGPPLVAIRHSRQLAAEPASSTASPCPSVDTVCYRTALPEDVAAGDLVSLVVRARPWLVEIDALPSLRVGDRALPVVEALRTNWFVTLVSERFILGAGEREVVFSSGRPRQAEPTVEIEMRRWRWLRSSGFPAAAAPAGRREPERLAPAGTGGPEPRLPGVRRDGGIE